MSEASLLADDFIFVSGICPRTEFRNECKGGVLEVQELSTIVCNAGAALTGAVVSNDQVDLHEIRDVCASADAH